MRIKKLRADEKKIVLSYEKESVPGQLDDYSVTFHDKAVPSFYKSLDNLKGDVVSLCEFRKELEERIKVTGVTFSYDGETDIMGATIVAQVKLKNSTSPLNVATPHKVSELKDGKGNKKALLTEGCVTLLEKVKEECVSYIDGKREQTNLFDKSGKKKPKK